VPSQLSLQPFIKISAGWICGTELAAFCRKYAGVNDFVSFSDSPAALKRWQPAMTHKITGNV
jgi:hypothetical protein